MENLDFETIRTKILALPEHQRRGLVNVLVHKAHVGLLAETMKLKEVLLLLNPDQQRRLLTEVDSALPKRQGSGFGVPKTES